jgi:hypothetical protein
MKRKKERKQERKQERKKERKKKRKKETKKERKKERKKKRKKKKESFTSKLTTPELLCISFLQMLRTFFTRPSKKSTSVVPVFAIWHNC